MSNRRRRRAISARRQALDDALARLARLHPRKIDLSLGRLQRLLSALGDPQERVAPVLHVAGTNGKGSTCAFLAAMAKARGERVHIYSSPHLVRFNERIALYGEPVDDKLLIDALHRCEAANFGEPVTFFEITTAAAFLLFSEHEADRIVLETGLGGRFDATNVVAKPAATVITPVALDHQEFLGPNIENIAREKAGIFKFGAPAVIGLQEPAAEQVLLEHVKQVGAPAFVWGRDYMVTLQHGRLVYEDEGRVWDLPPPGLLGPHQFNNAGAAAAAAVVLGWDEAETAEGVAKARWPGRLQHLNGGPLGELARKSEVELWVDGGHNEAAARALSIAFADMNERAPRPLVIVAGFSPNKDASAWFAQFDGLARHVYAVEFESGRIGCQKIEKVVDAANQAGLKGEGAPSLIKAVKSAVRDHPASRILVGGSLYLAGEALALGGEGKPQQTPG
jgi:dihydrofolate synthase/folylpolyglutamate synthase